MEDLLKTILTKLDSIEREVRALYEAIATNEAEHRNFEKQLEQLYECANNKQTDATRALAWFAMLAGLMLTLVNLLQKF